MNNFLLFPPETAQDLLMPMWGNTPLMLAAGNADVEQVERLLREGADIRAESRARRTALHWAADFGYHKPEQAIQIINLLLDRGAEIDAQDDDGVTPLMNAAYRRYLPIVRSLIERGADVNIRRDDGNTILGSIWGTPSFHPRAKRLIKMLEEAGGVV